MRASSGDSLDAPGPSAWAYANGKTLEYSLRILTQGERVYYPCRSVYRISTNISSRYQSCGMITVKSMFTCFLRAVDEELLSKFPKKQLFHPNC